MPARACARKKHTSGELSIKLTTDKAIPKPKYILPVDCVIADQSLEVF